VIASCTQDKSPMHQKTLNIEVLVCLNKIFVQTDLHLYMLWIEDGP